MKRLAVLLLALMSVTMVLTGLSGTAQAAEVPQRSVQVRWDEPAMIDAGVNADGETVAPKAAAVAAQAVGSFCVPGPNVVDRTRQCVFVPAGEILFFEGPIPVGGITFEMTRQITLNPRSRTFTEQDLLVVANTWGETAGTIFAGWTASCGGTCTATTDLPTGPRAIVKGLTLEGTISYSDSTATRHTTHTMHTLEFDNPAFPPIQVINLRSADYRCDNELAQINPTVIRPTPAGCVFPDYTPTLTSMGLLPNIANNIGTVQQQGPHHYGSKALGGDPLTRTTNAQRIVSNRLAACPLLRLRPLGTSCDEYPFASTNQGASQTTQPDWGYANVPVGEQFRQGGFLGSFYTGNRVLNNDPFWVQV